MPNIALQLEYDGSRFFGFQRQKDRPTIQEELEKALSTFANHKVEIITAGRTDTGVHAMNQVVNFTTEAKRELHGWVRGVNALLPDAIAIKKAAIVPDNFNARFDAISRTYYYYLCVRRSRPGLLNGKVGWYYDHLDIAKMKKACSLLRGFHDFSSFRATNCQASTPIREMLSCDLHVENAHAFTPEYINLITDPKNVFLDSKNGISDPTNIMPDLDRGSNLNESLMLRFEFTANAFLYHMVRNLVGALLYVGKGNLSVIEFHNLLVVRDRKLAPPTFMPDGLYLAAVNYATDIFS